MIAADKLLRSALTAAWSLDDPAAAWVLSNLAGIASVTIDDQTPTASIQKSGDRYSIRFGADFVKNYIREDRDALFVLLHEIMHKVNGDFVRDLAEKTPLQRHVANIAEDIYINAELCRRFFPRGIALLSRLYNHRRFPDCLLLPPAHYFAQSGREEDFSPDMVAYGDSGVIFDLQICNEQLEEWEKIMMPFLLQVEGAPPPEQPRPNFKIDPSLNIATTIFDRWFEGWFMTRCHPMTEYYDALLPLFPGATEVMLLGDHACRDGGVPAWTEGFSDEGGIGGEEGENEIEVEVPWTKVSRVAGIIRRMIEPDPHNPVEAPLLQPERGVLPWPGRRESLWLAAGVWPVFFNAPTMTRDLDYLRPHLYIDVSASTDAHQPKIFGLVAHLSDLIGEPVYFFSNTVVEASMEDVAKGRVLTTGGTDFDCVIQHAARDRFRKIIIITDGCADISPRNLSLVTGGEIKVLMLLTEEIKAKLPFETVVM